MENKETETTLVILTGATHSGKTTFAKIRAEENPGSVGYVSRDEIHVQQRITNPIVLTELVFTSIEKLLSEGKTEIIVDDLSNNYLRYRNKLVTYARILGMSVQIIHCVKHLNPHGKPIYTQTISQPYR